MFFLCGVFPAESRGEQPSPSGEETMLMFVGEELDVISIASRREESAWQAPAVARIITSKEIREKGFLTLGQALESATGFHMATKEWGTEPYLRGIPNSALILYDTVPTASDTTKTLNPLGMELSLFPIKRIEIIRGPGSVLWGPDAFAGIVNLVPMTGKDLDGTETGLLYGSPGEGTGFFINHGYNAGFWDAFVALGGRTATEDESGANITEFWGDGIYPTSPENRTGEKYPGESRYIEATGRFSFGKSLAITGRFSDYRRPFTIADDDRELTWVESRSAPSGFIKLEANKALGLSSALRFTGAHSFLRPEYDIIDKTLSQKEETTFAELIYDRAILAGRGLFTGGLYYRKKYIRDAPIWDGYFPEYLTPDNEFLLPIITNKDYDARLFSVFAQYTHKFGDVDVWLGIRNDEHDIYQDHLSFNTGAAWSVSSQWMLKLVYGTAYRTPFASQLRLEEKPDQDNIESISAEIAWKPTTKMGASLCLFANRIDNHVMEDPYAGLSEPNSQKLLGMEIEGRISPHKTLDFSANLTLLENSGDDETYRYSDYLVVDPDTGEISKHYTILSYPYDSGPDTRFNLMGTFRPFKNISLNSRLSYTSPAKLIYPRSSEFHTTPDVWLLDAGLNFRNLFSQKLDLSFHAKNLTDRRYEIPGTYSTIDGDPLTLEVVLMKRW